MSRVQQILSQYPNASKQVLRNLEKILNHGELAGTGKVVILPVDQGFEHGPTRSFSKNPEGYSPEYHAHLAIQSGCNAYAAPLGFMEQVSHLKNIPLILKLNHSDSLYSDPSAPIPAVVASVDQAKKLGCVGVGYTIYPGSAKRKEQYEQVAKLTREAKEQGLVVVIWSYPRGAGVSKEGETALDVVAYAAHIACQLGAHIVKVKPPTSYIEQEKAKKCFESENIPITTLSDRVRHVIQSAFNGKRVVIFSGGEIKDTSSFLEEVKELKKGGAFGSIVGRNAFQRPQSEAIALLKEVMNIYKQ